MPNITIEKIVINIKNKVVTYFSPVVELACLLTGYCLIASRLNKFGALVLKAIALIPHKTLSVWNNRALS
jgi:hypothetical protein